MSDFTPEQTKKLELAEKLFRTAGRSPEEAAQYTARAMAILEELNLDMSAIEQGGGTKSKRADELHSGGRYLYQRALWEALAKLHFCFYWNQYTWKADKVSPYHAKKYGMASARANPGGYVWQHRIVGRKVNCVAIRNTAEYLEQTVERLTREHLLEEKRDYGAEHLVHSNYAVSFRQGITEEVIDKIYNRREAILAEETRKAHEAAERAAAAGMAGDTGRALTLGSVAEKEHIENYDFLNGEGAWARKEARKAAYEAEWEAGRAERARKAAEAEAVHAKWAAANPKEAAKQEAEAAKARRRRATRGYSAPTEKDNRDYRAYQAGRRVGTGVSIEPQTGGKGVAGLL